MRVLAPDLTISEIVVQSAGPHRFITVRVANEGELTVADVEVVLRKDTVGGEVLATFTVTESIVPGTFLDVSWVWEDAGPFIDGAANLYAIVDESGLIAEFDEDNNVRSTTVTGPVAQPGDLNLDGCVDFDDFSIFAGCMMGPEIPYPEGCGLANLDGDADADMSDLAVFQQLYSER